MPEPVTRPAPFSLRLTPEDRARLDRDAAGMPLGAYIKWRLFDPANPPPRLRGKFPVKDHQAVAALLGKLGSTRIANNLNQLTRAAHSGSLVLTPDIEAELHEAAADIAVMRNILVKALGLSDGEA